MAVFGEETNVELTADELRLAEERVCSGVRGQFERYFFEHYSVLNEHIRDDLALVAADWSGNLAVQARQYEAWMRARLTNDLTPLSMSASVLGNQLVREAEERFRRIVEAFRNRLERNINQTLGVSVSPLAWEPTIAELKAVSTALGQTFMTHWDLLWWLLPMPLIGGMFRRHILGRVPWELEKNLFRLTSDWTEVVNAGVADLRRQAVGWTEQEITVLGRLLDSKPNEVTLFQESLMEVSMLRFEDATA